MTAVNATSLQRIGDISPVRQTSRTASTSIDNLAIDQKAMEEQVEEAKESRIVYGHNEDDAAFLANFPDEKKKKMYRKIDWRLIPMLALLYLISYIDRANLGNARIEGIVEELGIVGSHWNLAVSIFFVTYVICEVPSNAILHKYFHNRPSIWMAILIVSWGIVTTCISATRNTVGLVMARFCLGIPESGFYPGAILLTSYWYPRYMLQTRIALFYTSSATAGAFSGLLAFAIAKMDGIAGLSGWRWIFLLEGIATICVGIAVPWLLIDTPAKAKWLDDDEKRYIQLSVQVQDGGAAAQARSRGVDWKEFRKVVTDWHIYFFALMYWSAAIPNTAFTFTLPSIIRGMGYTSSDAQLLTIPPYFLGACAAFAGGYFADKYKRRYPFIVGPLCIVVVAMSILIPMAPRIRSFIGPGYFAVSLAHLGFYPLGPCINTWNANSMAGPAKRAMAISYLLALGNSGSIIGSYIFIADEAPYYPTGYGVAMGSAFLGITAATVIFFTFRFNNKQRAALSEEEIREKYTDDQLAEAGDRSPFYRYTL